MSKWATARSRDAQKLGYIDRSRFRKRPSRRQCANLCSWFWPGSPCDVCDFGSTSELFSRYRFWGWRFGSFHAVGQGALGGPSIFAISGASARVVSCGRSGRVSFTRLLACVWSLCYSPSLRNMRFTSTQRAPFCKLRGAVARCGFVAHRARFLRVARIS